MADANQILVTKEYVDNTFSNALKGSASGEAFLLDDVSPVSHEMAVKVRGKNLIPYPYADTTKTLNGITFTDNGDGTITANGTATAQTDFVVKQNLTVPAGTYILSNYIDADKRVFLGVKRNGGNTEYYNNTAFNINDGDIITFIYIRITNGTECTNVVFSPQLELGTSATAYTPYISDLTDVKVTKLGKNLFDKDNPNKINGYFSADGDSISPVPSTRSIYLACKPNTSYTASKITSARFALGFTSEVPAGGVEVNGVAFSSSGATTLTSTSPADAKYLVVWFYHQSYDTGITEDEIMNTIQVELGSAATEYEAYVTPVEYTPDSDGTVDDVMSLYPNTTLMTDTTGAIIDCEYNADIKKYIDKKFAELTALVLEG